MLCFSHQYHLLSLEPSYLSQLTASFSLSVQLFSLYFILHHIKLYISLDYSTSFSFVFFYRKPQIMTFRFHYISLYILLDFVIASIQASHTPEYWPTKIFRIVFYRNFAGCVFCTVFWEIFKISIYKWNFF